MQHEIGDSLDDMRKWAKMDERYGNTTLNSVKDIFEIKYTLKDLATRLDKTQLRAVTPEKKKSSSHRLHLQRHILENRHQLRQYCILTGLHRQSTSSKTTCRSADCPPR